MSDPNDDKFSVCPKCGAKTEPATANAEGHCDGCGSRLQPNESLEERLFREALETDEDRRLDALRQKCAEDSSLYQRIVALLDAHASPAEIFRDAETPPTETAPHSPHKLEKTRRIGQYNLLQKIGEGGMGSVYMAEQSSPVRRRVALKLIRDAYGNEQSIARFEAERQALAMMEHPNIAKMLDAGTTDTGSPFFVMELVKGVPITKFCDERELSPKQRLDLIIPVCQAVQHAHRKGIIHRDIKPSNVLVAEYDGRPVPKVIDFGVAKALNQSLTEKTMFTHYGQIVGTLEYMSPEQARLSQLDIDTRSDVYSLGVLLYELLTSTTPFEKMKLRSAALDELLRIIREEEPPRPSVRIGSSDALLSIAAKRNVHPEKLGRLVAGDLDLIVMKAIQKDRGARYQSASDFADDIDRYLRGDAIHARRPTTSYRLKKFVRRNKGLVTASTLILATATIGTAVSAHYGIDAFRQKERVKESQVDALLAADLVAVPGIVRSMRTTLDETHSLILAEYESGRLNEDEMFRVRLALAERDDRFSEALLQDAIEGDPEKVAACRQFLKPLSKQVQQPLHEALLSETASDQRRLAAASILAVIDPKDDVLLRSITPITDSLLRRQVTGIPRWRDLLAPLHDQLVEELLRRFSINAQESNDERSKVLSTVLPIADANPRPLLEFCLRGTSDELATIAHHCDAFRNSFIALLPPVFEETLAFNWNDNRLDSDLGEIDQSLTDLFAKHQGRIHDQFAFCFAMPRGEFEAQLPVLNERGYRPASIRLTRNGSEQRVSAIWHRDGRTYHWAADLSEDEVYQTNDRMKSDGLVLVDVCSMERVHGDVKYFALWVENKRDLPQTKPALDIDANEVESRVADERLAGFRPYRLHQRDRSRGRVNFVLAKDSKNVRLRVNVPWTTPPSSFLETHSSESLIDIAAGETIITNDERMRAVIRRLNNANALLRIKPGDDRSLFNRGWARFYRRHYELALVDFNELINRSGPSVDSIAFRARCWGRLNHEEAAKHDLDTLKSLCKKPGYLALVEATVLANLGKFEQAERHLEHVLDQSIPDYIDVYNVACAYAQLADIAKTQDEARFEHYCDEANAVLNLAFSCGLSVVNVQADPDWMPVTQKMNAKRLLQSISRKVYSGVWEADRAYEYRSLISVPAEKHLETIDLWIQQGFRPQSLTVGDRLFLRETDRSATDFGSVWKRPRVLPGDVSGLSSRKANAAVLLARFGMLPEALQLLSGPELVTARSLFTDRAIVGGVDPMSLCDAVATVESEDVRRMLVLAVGNGDAGDRTADLREVLDRVVPVAASSGPGMQAALRWTQRSLNRDGAESIATGDEIGSPHRSTSGPVIHSSQGHELIVVKSPSEFTIGSDPSDAEQDLDEPTRVGKIPHDFAMSIFEVAQAQFDEFLKDRSELRRPYQQPINPEPSGPALRVSWYAAAAYCNWLSHRDGIPPEQWCYRPNENGEYAEGMTLADNYVDRVGYRLPTAAEWEYTCRAGRRDSPRFFGDSLSVLSDFAWHAANSSQRAHAVGKLMPNPFGFHDIMGNAWEWCNDAYASNGQPRLGSKVTDSVARELRGGSWQTGSRSIRSAERHSAFAAESASDFGFRIVRTVPSEKTAKSSDLGLSDWRYRKTTDVSGQEGDTSVANDESIPEEHGGGHPEPAPYQFKGKTAAALQKERQSQQQAIRVRFARWARPRLDEQVRNKIDKDLRDMYFPVDSINRYIDELPEEDRQAYRAQQNALSKRFRDAMISLAREKTSTKVGFDAWQMILRNNVGIDVNLQQEAVDAVIDHHLNSVDMYNLIRSLGGPALSDERERLLRAAAESKFSSVARVSKMALAGYLHTKYEAARLASDVVSENEARAWFAKLWVRGHEDPNVTEIALSTRQRWIDEVRELCAQVLQEATDRRTRDSANKLLHRVDRISVGKSLADLTLVDAEDNTVKLGDFAGRKVVLFSWQNLWLKATGLYQSPGQLNTIQKSLEQLKRAVASGEVVLVAINWDSAKSRLDWDLGEKATITELWEGRRERPMLDLLETGSFAIVLDESGTITDRSVSRLRSREQVIESLADETPSK